MMSAAYLLYNMVAGAAAPPMLAGAAISGRLRGHWRDRLGLVPSLGESGEARVWVHAVSAGEIQAAIPLIAALKKHESGLSVWLSTTTAAGRQAAKDQLPAGCPIITYPLDMYGSPARAMNRLKPSLVILLETELWPNFLRVARIRGIKTMLANGRISDRSVRRYRRVVFLFREVLANLDMMAMIREEDRERIISMGADPGRVKRVGNAKYDFLLQRVDPGRVIHLRQALGLADDRPVLVAGSTRSGEEIMVLNAFERLRGEFPRLHLILAPRHIQRAGLIESRIRARGLTMKRFSQDMDFPQKETSVTLVDVIGELFYCYGLATVAFCGGSLVPLGGQNPLEAAAWGRPVLYGPYMDDFKDAREMLEPTGGGQTVVDTTALVHRIRAMLTSPREAEARGQAALECLRRHEGASIRLAAMALDLLAMDKRVGT